MATTSRAHVRADLDMELVPLGTLWAQLAPPIVLQDTPVGTRMIFEVVEGTFEGERLRGRSRGNAGADWGLAGPGGVFGLDVRFVLETHDGALVFVQYAGRCDITNGLENPGFVYGTPRFETGDERYRWLNSLQAVQKGRLDPETLQITYKVFEVR
ncbi:MAG TPA: DUF3237 domain-containing protein [Miltoncostaeaceae bacterium]|nr:DUF3237 domain-containing protein [Miltoncostaeaceae bacterium]